LRSARPTRKPCSTPSNAPASDLVGHLPPYAVDAQARRTEGGRAFGTVMHVEGNYSHDWLANYPTGQLAHAAEKAAPAE
jgi:hypothetical protein